MTKPLSRTEQRRVQTATFECWLLLTEVAVVADEEDDLCDIYLDMLKVVKDNGEKFLDALLYDLDAPKPGELNDLGTLIVDGTMTPDDIPTLIDILTGMIMLILERRVGPGTMVAGLTRALSDENIRDMGLHLLATQGVVVVGSLGDGDE